MSAGATPNLAYGARHVGQGSNRAADLGSFDLGMDPRCRSPAEESAPLCGPDRKGLPPAQRLDA